MPFRLVPPAVVVSVDPGVVVSAPVVSVAPVVGALVVSEPESLPHAARMRAEATAAAIS